MVRSVVLSGAVSTCLLLAGVLVASAQSDVWQPGPGAVADDTYMGFIDSPSAGAGVASTGAFNVSGWFVDTTAEGWAGADDVQVWLGSMDGGGTMLAKAAFAQSRPDVATALNNPFWDASGFTATVLGASVPPGSQALNLYVHTPGKGWWFKSVLVNGGASAPAAAPAPAPSGAAPAPAAPAASGNAPQLTITSPTNDQLVSTKSDFTITGKVDDPANTDVDIWINGERNTHYATELGTTKPNPDGTWSLTFAPTHFPSMHSVLFIYAKNRVSGIETLVSVEINIVDRSV